MRIHKGRGAAYDVDKERQWNWYRPARSGFRRNGPVKQFNIQELRELAEREGLILSPNATFAAVRPEEL